MNRKSRIAVACFLALTLVATLGLGCGDDEEEGKVTITVGHITDMTGPASSAYRAVNFALEDVFEYVNQEELIPGVNIKIITYDTGYNPAKDVPGYDWCIDRGAEVIYAGLPSAGIYKPFAERDKIPVVTLAVSKQMIDPPEWIFCMNAPVSYQMKAFLKWINEEHWDYDQGIPKIGSVGWMQPYRIEIAEAISEYAEDHSGQFEVVDNILVPTSVMTWAGEIEKLKGCDYVVIPTAGLDTVTFAKEFREKVGTAATFIGTDAIDAFQNLLVDAVGWEEMDGTLAAHGATRWWDEPYPIIELAEELLHKYHANEADDIIRAGIGYIGGFHQAYGFFEVLQKAIGEVGAENFDAQAFYNAAIGLEVTWEGYEQWEFTPTKRYSWNYVGIYGWSEADQAVLRVVDEWVPNLVE
ncbi:MAG: ABC transporter substrate-binding protein [Dehalococcoidia bacterium]|nr:ABC transporter substrate-binding protein [Dehalococcoidia bacterium]